MVQSTFAFLACRLLLQFSPLVKVPGDLFGCIHGTSIESFDQESWLEYDWIQELFEAAREALSSISTDLNGSFLALVRSNHLDLFMYFPFELLNEFDFI